MNLRFGYANPNGAVFQIRLRQDSIARVLVRVLQEWREFGQKRLGLGAGVRKDVHGSPSDFSPLVDEASHAAEIVRMNQGAVNILQHEVGVDRVFLGFSGSQEERDALRAEFREGLRGFEADLVVEILSCVAPLSSLSSTPRIRNYHPSNDL